MSITDAAGNPPSPAPSGLYLHLSTTRIVVIAIALLTPWVLIVVKSASRPRANITSHQPIAAVPPTAPTTTASHSPVPAGPWGELEVTPIQIEAPADAAVRFAQADTSTWYFPHCTSDKLSGILKSAGLTDAQRQSIVQAATPDPASDGLAVKPDPAIVAALSYEVRTALYQVLADDPRNAQSEPFRRPPDPANDWFADLGLNEQAASLAKRLVYRRGDLEAFADVSIILPALHTDAERNKLFRALSSQSVLVVRLRIGPQSDLHALLDYWGKDDRQREIQPLLESLAKVPGGDAINIAQILPQFVRTRLYTYPEPVGSAPNGPFDCHWTSLNFWNATPDNRCSNANFVRELLGSAYHRVEKPSQLGDIIFFLNKDGQGIHSATFIAEDIVFTKNGTSISAPWVLMRLPSLLSYYENIDPLKTMVFRKNSL